MLNLIIIEDDEAWIKQILTYTDNMRNQISIPAILTDVYAAINYLKKYSTADIILMNTNLKEGSTFKILIQVQVNIPIIYMSAHDMYMASAFKQNGINYLIKPFTQNQFEKAIEKYYLLKKHFLNNKQLFKITE